MVDYFQVYRCEPEVVFAIPALADDDPPLEIAIAAVGGATIGRAYANNDWIYGVRLAGTLVCSGVDLRSGGTGRTHREMAGILAEFLCDSESIPPPLWPYTQRLTSWPSACGLGG
jgi:hypothetical protein